MVRELDTTSRAASPSRAETTTADQRASTRDRGTAPALHAAGADAVPIGTLLPARVTTMWQAAWGSGPGDLGRKPANESSPEGPMSFAVDASGRTFVLDQVNERVQVFEDGGISRSIPVSGMTFQDVAVRDDGGLALLDRLGDSAISFVDGEGRVSQMVSLAGPAIPDGGSVTAMFQRADGTWVEVDHQQLVRVADTDGRPDSAQPVVAGRFRYGGQELLRAARVGTARAAITVQTPGGAVDVFAYAEFPMAIANLTALESDASGRVFLGASLYEEAAEPPFDVVAHAEVVAVFDATGTELGRIELDSYAGPEERFCTIRVGPDGAIYHLVFGDDGVALRRYEL